MAIIGENENIESENGESESENISIESQWRKIVAKTK
jgi:hypothetical protein